MTMQETTTAVQTETSKEPVFAPHQDVMVNEPTPRGRDAEIDEVMQFLEFSVKPTTKFSGTILFKFKGIDGKPESSYAVIVDDQRDVSTKKNATAADVNVTCEVTISVDDFLWLYSGKASGSDLVKMFYAGRISISGYAFRKVSAFAQSFDFSSDQWRKFYKWRDEQEKSLGCSSSASGETWNVGSPSRDCWFFHCRSLLERYNISQLQRLQWEMSLSSLFGEGYVMGNVYKIAAKKQSCLLADRSSSNKYPNEFVNVIGTVMGAHSATWKQRDYAKKITGWGALSPVDQDQHKTKLERELVRFFNPCAKHSAKFVNTVSLQELFEFFDDEYVDAVKSCAKERFQQRHVRNRIDLADAGRAQLDKLVKVIGKGGHHNQMNNRQSKYVPAPEVLLREFHASATVVMDTIKEKALGRKSLHKIPAPNVDWLFGGNHTGNLLVVDDRRINEGNDDSKKKEMVVSSSVMGIPPQAIVEVNRAQLHRRRGKRDLSIPKQRLKAKFASISRDLAQPNRALVISNVEEHLIFSDYV